METPRFELAPTTRFADRASDYAQFRPSYPREAIDAALHGLVAERLVAADIGAGTGISSRRLADRGVRVLAIEPNAAMRESAESHANVTFMEGRGEASGLDGSSVDLVLCAQAFHWFKPREAFVEFRRILKPGGRLVFMINERDDADPPMRDYNAALRKAAERELSEGMRSSIEDALRAESLEAAPQFFTHTQALSREGLIGRARSASYVPKAGPRHEELLCDLEGLWARHRNSEGFVTLGYRTLVFVVTPLPSH